MALRLRRSRDGDEGAPSAVPSPSRGWWWLIGFWSAVLSLLASGAVILQLLGPLPAKPAQPVTAASGQRPSAPSAPSATAIPAQPPSEARAALPALPALVTPPAPLGPPTAPAMLPPVAAAPSSRLPGSPIAPADPALQEPVDVPAGAVLPRIGPRGELPRQVYAGGAEPSDARPRAGLLLADFAMREADSEEALRLLSPAVSFAVSPYAPRPGRLVELARVAGHELLVSIPMEPRGYPMNDPGNQALLTGNAPAANLAALRWSLSRVQGYVGATGALGGMRGERFAASDQMIEVLAELGQRGLLYIDARVGGVLPESAVPPAILTIDIVVDEPAVRTEIEAKLVRLESLARDRGFALGLASAPVPVTVERIAAWTARLAQRGVVLVPVSALIAEAAQRPRRPSIITPTAPVGARTGTAPAVGRSP